MAIILGLKWNLIKIFSFYIYKKTPYIYICIKLYLHLKEKPGFLVKLGYFICLYTYELPIKYVYCVALGNVLSISGLSNGQPHRKKEYNIQ